MLHHFRQIIQAFPVRNANPLDSVVVSVTVFNAGNAFNVIPQEAILRGTVRTLSPQMRDLAEERMGNIVKSIAEAFDARAELEFRRGYPVTANHDDQTDFAAEIAEGIAGDGKVNRNIDPMMGGEDFSYMLEERPGAFIFAGNGDTAGLHHPEYDFNDELIPVGCSYWVKLVETALPAKAA